MEPQNMKKKINVTNKQNVKSENNTPSIEKMPILEYLEVVKSEYNNERQKKCSFESRAGISIAFTGTLCAFLLDEIKISDIIRIINIVFDDINNIAIIDDINNSNNRRVVELFDKIGLCYRTLD